VLDDLEKQQKNRWYSIYALMGVQAGSDQNVISEILKSYHMQNEVMDRIYSKFAKGEKVDEFDLKEDHIERSSNQGNLNFS